MFNSTTAKTLIVVYKDELLANQIKKLVETNDDNGTNEVVGTRDNSIKIVSSNEKTWLSNKKAGNIDSKVLFIGNIKGVDKLIPVIDVKFNKYGVKYGWAGKQAVIYIADKELSDTENYSEFLKAIEDLPIPDSVKNANEPLDTKIMDKAFNKVKVANKIKNEKLSKFVNKSVEFAEKASNDVAYKTHEVFKDRPIVKKQMLFYGILNLYNNDLETFMNS